MKSALRCLAVVVLAIGLSGHDARLRAQPGIAPVVVVETPRGTLRFVTFPNEAPLSVAHILDLVRKGFYDGQRIHRVQPGFVIQFGDPQTRDLAQRELWGRGTAAGSGKPIGVAEMSTKRRHLAGAVGIAHTGTPDTGDSQMYITLAPRPDLDGQYTVIGQVVDGEDVLPRLAIGDEIRRVYVQE